jgi:hypothetical protein
MSRQAHDPVRACVWVAIRDGTGTLSGSFQKLIDVHTEQQFAIQISRQGEVHPFKSLESV